MQYLAVAVAAVFQGLELEERQGLVPGVYLPVAWYLGLDHNASFIPQIGP
jgi:hypothetical protein